jgi:putative hydrolase of the HAD superfamily
MVGSTEFDVIGFDADDTLWFSEDSFRHYEEQFVELVSPFVEHGVDVKAALVATERSNISAFGYGVKSFGLSAIETAITLSNSRVSVDVLHEILTGVRAHITESVRVFEGVSSVLEQVARTHRIILITKGDLAHQTRKVETSGLAHLFAHVEIVLEKDPSTYAHALKSLDIDPRRFCMVGNSMKSDVLPVLAIGGFAVHVPYEILWELDSAETAPESDARFIEIASLADFPAWLNAR